MKTITKEFYVCEICGHEYEDEKQARDCEGRQITQDKGISVGDKVLITGGDGCGSLGLVKSVFVIDKYWGHYAWKRYWHTIAISADIIGSYGTRMLTFDDYERETTTTNAEQT
jgi:hypothetical protein